MEPSDDDHCPPPDLENRLAAEAQRRGTTPELLAVDGLRRLYPPVEVAAILSKETMADRFAGRIGRLRSGVTDSSVDPGARMTVDLEVKRQAGHL